MYLGLPQVEFGIISFPYRPGKVEYPGFGFKGKAEASAKVSMIDLNVLAAVSAPACIGQHIEVGILANQVAILHCSDGKLGNILAFLIKSSE